jgi:hypothetical protein
MSKAKITIPPEKLELYDKLIASDPNIERKGKTTPYTSVNGHMFTFLTKEGTMGLRLSKEDQEKFMKRYNSKPMVQHGVVMKEYVLLNFSTAMNSRTLIRIPIQPC